jgi:hypothetical protein
MKIMQAIIAIITIFITIPIWYYLLYKVLQSIGATDLMWFLFWVYVPFGLLMHFLQSIVKQLE